MQKITFVNHTEYPIVVKTSQKRISIPVRNEDWTILPIGHIGTQLEARILWPFKLTESVSIKLDEDISTVGIFFDDVLRKYINLSIYLLLLFSVLMVLHFSGLWGLTNYFQNYLPAIGFCIFLTIIFSIYKATKRLKMIESAFVVILD